ncbi:putative bifunctional diguanylate cyclase/phosphodiesterase [Bacillus sp. DJP31]|uniref:putative bifunctional diguanylate cyclase/phosphodiesterase n=1 Tax=Bacillus sp. DJP31 TaxID=3409789 RepID=UPI003BB71542
MNDRSPLLHKILPISIAFTTYLLAFILVKPLFPLVGLGTIFFLSYLIIKKDQVLHTQQIAIENLEIELKESHIELSRTQDDLEDIFNNSGTAIWSKDRPSEVLTVSLGYEEVLGLPRESFYLNPILWRELVHPDDLEMVKGFEKRLLIKEDSCIYRIIRTDGTVRWIKNYGKPIKDEEGNIVKVIGIITDVTEQKLAEQKVSYLAYHDSLTGLPNRHQLGLFLEEALEKADKEQEQLAVLFMDLDRFKLINDTFGHHFGDKFLYKVSERIQLSLSDQEHFFRQGGDEFVIVIEKATRPIVMETAENILAILTDPFYLDNLEIFTSTSIGISFYPLDGPNVETLLANADKAMYTAKEKGKNTSQFYTEEIEDSFSWKMELDSGLRKALINEEFSLYYQPQIDLETIQIIGFEALLRWEHPTYGFIAPDEFIPLAEENGMIIPIGKWVLQTACQQLADWNRIGFDNLDIAINVSARQFQHGDFVQTVKDVLKATSLDPNFLELEITESMVHNIDETMKILQSLKKLGVKISIDDFGTGYSSLSYLENLPIDYIKIDKSFVDKIQNDDQKYAMIRTIIDMGNNLEFKVIAEGIETENQLAFLKKQKCHYGQGYLFGKPLPAQDAFQVLQTAKVKELRL